VEISDPYVDEDSLPILEGMRMCPRCMDCTVGVGSYSPPFESLGHQARYLPLASSLRPEPTSDPLGEPEAWYCAGGCNEKGEHPWQRGNQRGFPVPASFIGRINKAR
jgi:hypothetical protein